MSRRLAAAAAALVAVVAVLLGTAAPVLAQSAPPQVVVRAVDAAAYPRVSMTVMTTGGVATGDLTATQDGEAVDGVAQPIAQSGQPVGTVLVADVSNGVTGDGWLPAVKQALHAYVGGRMPTERIALVRFGNQAQVMSGFTTDGAVLDRAIDSLDGSGDPVLWDALRLGVGLFADVPGLQANLLLVSPGHDAGSAATAAQVRSAATSADVAVLAAFLGDGTGAVRDLVAATDGTTASAADPAATPAAGATVGAAVRSQVVLSYTGPVLPVGTPLTVAVAADGASDTVSVNVGQKGSGSLLRPSVVTGADAPGSSLLDRSTWKVIAIVLGAAAALLLAWALIGLLGQDRTTLDDVLSHYGNDPAAPADAGEAGMAETKFVKRAVELTTDLARRQGLLPRLERGLEQADLPLRAGEALFFYAAGALLLTVVAAFVTRSPIIGLIVAGLSVLLPPAVLQGMAKQRRARFLAQLPDALQLLAGSLRAGYSLMQGIEAVSREVAEPMGKELRRVVLEARLGRPVEDALEDSAERMASPDFAWAVMAIGIQREVGGNLAELLDTVAETMLSRERLRREVKALTAEGRMSAIVLGVMPILLGAAMWTINPDYVKVLIEEPAGNIMLGISVVLAVVGFWWMKKTVEIEV